MELGVGGEQRQLAPWRCATSPRACCERVRRNVVLYVTTLGSKSEPHAKTFSRWIEARVVTRPWACTGFGWWFAPGPSCSSASFSLSTRARAPSECEAGSCGPSTMTEMPNDVHPTGTTPSVLLPRPGARAGNSQKGKRKTRHRASRAIKEPHCALLLCVAALGSAFGGTPYRAQPKARRAPPFFWGRLSEPLPSSGPHGGTGG